MKKTLFVVLAVLFCASIALTGCGPSDATAKPNFTPIPKTDELKLAMFEFPVTVDAHYWKSPAGLISFNVYDGLLEGYLGNPFDLRPCLATKYEVSDNGLVYTFTIREGVKFHNGDTMTVDDVVYSYNRWKAAPPNSEVSAVLQSVEKGTAPNTVVITVTAVSPTIIQTIGGIGIVSEKVMSTFDPAVENADRADRIVGTGAYKVTEFTIGSSIVLEYNDDYFMPELNMNGATPELKKVTFKLISDATAAMIAFNQGEINSVGSGQATAEDIADARARQKEAEDAGMAPPVRVTTSATAARYILAFNMDDPVVGAQNGTAEEKAKALKIRKAIGHAVNREQVNEVMFNGEAFIATQITNPLTEGYVEDFENLKEDPEMTKSILREIGYATSAEEVTDTKPRLIVDLLYITDTWATKFATTIQAQLQSAGIVVNMLGYELNSWFAKVYPSKNYQITYNAYTPNVPNPDTAFRSPYYSKSYWNPFAYNNPEVDELLDSARYDMNKESRVAKLQKINKIATQDDVIYIPILAGNSVAVVNTYWFGIFMEPTYSYYKFYKMFWEDDGMWTPDDGLPYLDGTLGTATPAA